MLITIRTRHTYTVTDPALLAARAELYTRGTPRGAAVPLRFDIPAALRTVLDHVDPAEIAELPEEFGLAPDAAATVLTSEEPGLDTNTTATAGLTTSNTTEASWGWLDQPFPDVDADNVLAHLITPPASAENEGEVPA